MKLAAYPGLFDLRLLEISLAPGEKVDYVEKRDDAEQAEQEIAKPHPVGRLVDFIVVADHCYLPIGILRHRGAVEGGTPLSRVVLETDHPDVASLLRVGYVAVEQGNYAGDVALPGQVTYYGLSRFGQEEAEGGRIEAMGVEGVAEPGQVDVQAADGDEPAFVVVERAGEGRKPYGIGAPPIEIRVAPA